MRTFNCFLHNLLSFVKFRILQFSGVRHKQIYCDDCRVSGMFGFRWKCAACDDYDLCNSCYMEGKHNRDHKFYRYDTFACRRLFPNSLIPTPVLFCAV